MRYTFYPSARPPIRPFTLLSLDTFHFSPQPPKAELTLGSAAAVDRLSVRRLAGLEKNALEWPAGDRRSAS